MIAYTDGRTVRLISRNAVDHTERFRELASAIAVLKAPTLILEGEVCVFEPSRANHVTLLVFMASTACTPQARRMGSAAAPSSVDARGRAHGRHHGLRRPSPAG